MKRRAGGALRPCTIHGTEAGSAQDEGTFGGARNSSVQLAFRIKRERSVVRTNLLKLGASLSPAAKLVARYFLRRTHRKPELKSMLRSLERQ